MVEQLNEYDPQQFEEEKGLSPGCKAEGVIVSIETGPIKNYLDKEQRDKWKGCILKPTIKVSVDVFYDGQEYNTDEFLSHSVIAQKIIVPKSPKSNLRKFYDKYGKLPEVGMKVLVETNSKGYWKLEL